MISIVFLETAVKEVWRMDSALDSHPTGRGSNPHRGTHNNLWQVVNLTLPRHRYSVNSEPDLKFKFAF
jgi:hypothetical protein